MTARLTKASNPVRKQKVFSPQREESLLICLSPSRLIIFREAWRDFKQLLPHLHILVWEGGLRAAGLPNMADAANKGEAYVWGSNIPLILNPNYRILLY